MRRFVSPVSQRLADEASEQVRRAHQEQIAQLQKQPAMQLGVIADVQLENGVETTVAHKLGRVPKFVTVSCPRGATSTGRVVEVRTGGHDRRHVVILVATGHGATITVDVAVM